MHKESDRQFDRLDKQHRTKAAETEEEERAKKHQEKMPKKKKKSAQNIIRKLKICALKA